MSEPFQLEKTDVIDLVALSATGDEIQLCLIATDQWDAQGNRTLQLQAKLKNYVAFAVDGQLERQHPEAKGKRIKIKIDSEYPLGAAERQLIEAARQHWCTPENIELVVTTRRT